jgi:hypothetical protein
MLRRRDPAVLTARRRERKVVDVGMPLSPRTSTASY